MCQMELLLNVYASQKVLTAPACVQDAGLRSTMLQSRHPLCPVAVRAEPASSTCRRTANT